MPSDRALQPPKEKDAAEGVPLVNLRVESTLTPLLGEFRGRPARDRAALARAMAGLSRLFLDHRPFLQDFEINPLIVLAAGAGVRAVDVRAVRR